MNREELILKEIKILIRVTKKLAFPTSIQQNEGEKKKNIVLFMLSGAIVID